MRRDNLLVPGRALVPVKDEALRTLLRCLYRSEITTPLDLPSLTRIGLQYCSSELLHHLRGLDQEGIKAVVIAVLAERKATELGLE